MFQGKEEEEKKEENYAGEFEPEGCKARVSGRRRRRRNISRHHAVLRLLNVMAREQQRQQPEEVSSSSSSFLKIEKKESKKDNIHVERRRGGRERDRQIPKGEGYRRAVTARADALFRSSTRSNWLPKRPLLLLHPPTLFTRSYISHPLYSVLVRRKKEKKTSESLVSLVKFKSRKQEDGFSSVWWHTSCEQRDRYFCSSLSLVRSVAPFSCVRVRVPPRVLLFSSH